MQHRIFSLFYDFHVLYLHLPALLLSQALLLIPYLVMGTTPPKRGTRCGLAAVTGENQTNLSPYQNQICALESKNFHYLAYMKG